MDERKKVKQNLVRSPSVWGFGEIRADFEAEKYDGSPLLDTRVKLLIAPFTITWENREKLLEELSKVITKYQI